MMLILLVPSYANVLYVRQSWRNSRDEILDSKQSYFKHFHDTSLIDVREDASRDDYINVFQALYEQSSHVIVKPIRIFSSSRDKQCTPKTIKRLPSRW